ncbi:hypothetical protein E2C01_062052 [Portunus trituberculatus]|uniref:Uncharacterized protein n=1 Tax=Portunus trituberculatus TaxID=210409 RepID=A0A5B7HEW3_PORTR|nr:hypothetical protein [Portunus trituberculatus]
MDAGMGVRCGSGGVLLATETDVGVMFVGEGMFWAAEAGVDVTAPPRSFTIGLRAATGDQLTTFPAM